MIRDIRYQGAIIRNDHILLIKHREHVTGRAYWVIPGGAREADETDEACVQREMREETKLDVIVERLLLEQVGDPGGVYQRLKTYLCTVIDGEPQPGHEPEFEVSQLYTISEVRWFDLRNLSEWGEVKSDPFTFPLVQRIRILLGYSAENPSDQE